MTTATLARFRPLPARRGLMVGLTAMAAALLAQWLLHQADGGFPYAPYSFGDAFIRRTPGDLATEAIERLGTNARAFIVLGITLAIVVAGILPALFWRWAAPVIGAGGSLVGAWLQPIEPSLANALIAAGVAALAAGLVVLLDLQSAGGAGNGHPEPALNRRRRMLVLGGLAAGFAALAITASIERATRGTMAGAVRAVKRLPVTSDPGFDAVPGLASLVTAPDDHYVIDINLSRPQLGSGDYRLTVRGEVQNPVNFSFAELVDLGATERAIHLQCISNQIGGPLAGNAVWSVVPLSALIEKAAPSASAATVVVRAYDGYHESYPLAIVPEVFVAVAMGGLEIPNAHGHPVRLLYPGHYGMRSIKWLTSIELIAGSEEGYWQKRGWDAEAPLLLNSRIDSPRPGEQSRRTVSVAGVAWGPEPITAVELSIDDGETWTVTAELEEIPDELSWVRWKAELTLEPGQFDVRSRAISGANVQDGEFRQPHPAGATGYDLRTVRIS